jgi:general secretion pathway protein L
MPVTVLLPAGEVVSTIAAVPSASASRLRQMLPFSLEDEFAGDIDDLHFAPGERNDTGDLGVSVIARERLDTWVERLKAAGIEANRICSEGDGVPDTPGSVTLFVEADRILGRRPGGAPFAFEGMTLDDLWNLLSSEHDDTADLDHVVVFVDSDAAERRQAEIDALRQRVGDLNVRELADGPLSKLAAGLVFRHGPNLLQGAYSSRTDFRALARPWQAAAGLAIVFLAVSVLGKGAELIKLNREESRLTAEAATICAESYRSPQLARCLAEMSRRLADTGQASTTGGSLFLPTLMAIAGSVDNAMAINSIGYSDEMTTLDVLAPAMSYLDPFTQQLESAGFAINLQNTTNEDNGIRVRLRITGVDQ